MKKNIYLITTFTLISIFCTTAQNVQKSITQLTSKTNARISLDDNSGIVQFAIFPEDSHLQLLGKSPKEKAIGFLKEHKSIYKMESIDDALTFSKSTIDNYGGSHTHFKQVYHGIPVFDGGLRFHFDSNDKLAAVNGKYIPDIAVNTLPGIGKTEAEKIALNLVKSQNLNQSGVPLSIHKNRLCIFQKGTARGYNGSTHLVYEIEVWNKTDVRESVFVDAHKGTVVEQFTKMAHAINRTVYEGSTNTTPIWKEGDVLPGSLDEWQLNEVEASGHVYRFFDNTFGYTSYDGADAEMITINNNPNIDCPNANWNGVTANYCDGTASDDVIAHEWGHAYTEYTNSLIYQWQSGAMNEAYSDIWGETVDLINAYEDDDEDNSARSSCDNSKRWILGEDATAFSGSLRDMWSPNCNGDPGKVSDSQYRCGTRDSGGVHTNSGVVNHLYVLLVDGGTSNNQTVEAIGLTKAAHIFWHTQKNYLTQSSDFQVLADALQASANDLLGVDLETLSTGQKQGPSGEIITTSDIDQVVNAILATELGNPPSQCNFEPLLPSIEPLCQAASNGPMFFEDWESGIGEWTVEQLPTNATTWTNRDWVINSSLPVSRSGSAIYATDPIIGDCQEDLENGIIRLQSPVISIPDTNEGVYEMTFTHYVTTESEWDGGNIKYSLNNGDWTLIPTTAFTANPYNLQLKPATQNDNPMAGEDAFSGTDEGSNTGSWGKSTIDLSALGAVPNAAIQFRWELGVDGCNGNDGWYIDDITIYNCNTVVLGITDLNEITENLTIVPNPVETSFILSSENRNLKSLEIYNIQGKSLRNMTLDTVKNKVELNIQEFPSGVYFVSVTTNDNTIGVIRLLKK